MAMYTFPDAAGHCVVCCETVTIPTVIRRLNPNRTDAPGEAPEAAYTFTFKCGHTASYDTDHHQITDDQTPEATVLTFERL